MTDMPDELWILKTSKAYYGSPHKVEDQDVLYIRAAQHTKQPDPAILVKRIDQLIDYCHPHNSAERKWVSVVNELYKIRESCKGGAE